MDLKTLILLIVGHLVADLPQGALPAVLPMLKTAHGLSYAQAGAIIMVMNLTSSVIQPLFGFLTDRWKLRWLLPVGLTVSGLGFAVLGLLPGYLSVQVAIVVCGLGVASFHPEAFKAVLGSTGARKVIGVSWFMVGGNAGFALGPIMAGIFALWLGLAGTTLFALPGLLVTGLFLLYWPRLKELKSLQSKADANPRPIGERWKPLSILVLAVILRSCVHSGVLSFVPFYYINHLGGSPMDTGGLLSTFLAAGALGTIAGAPLAERYGPKRFFVLSVLLTTPMILWFMAARGPWMYLALALAGGCLISTWSVVMVMAQQILPDRAGMASGLMVGFTLGTGGVGATVLGWVADHHGVVTVLWIVSALPILSGLVGMWVPAGAEGRPRGAVATVGPGSASDGDA